MLDPTGRITNWNAGAGAYQGLSGLAKLSASTSAHFIRQKTTMRRQTGTIAGNRRLCTASSKPKAWRLRKDGSRFMASVVIDPIYEDGELIGFAEITRDITERHMAAATCSIASGSSVFLVSSGTDYALYARSTG